MHGLTSIPHHASSTAVPHPTPQPSSFSPAFPPNSSTYSSPSLCPLPRPFPHQLHPQTTSSAHRSPDPQHSPRSTHFPPNVPVSPATPTLSLAPSTPLSRPISARPLSTSPAHSRLCRSLQLSLPYKPLGPTLPCSSHPRPAFRTARGGGAGAGPASPGMKTNGGLCSIRALVRSRLARRWRR